MFSWKAWLAALPSQYLYRIWDEQISLSLGDYVSVVQYQLPNQSTVSVLWFGNWYCYWSWAEQNKSSFSRFNGKRKPELPGQQLLCWASKEFAACSGSAVTEWPERWNRIPPIPRARQRLILKIKIWNKV